MLSRRAAAVTLPIVATASKTWSCLRVIFIVSEVLSETASTVWTGRFQTTSLARCSSSRTSALTPTRFTVVFGPVMGHAAAAIWEPERLGRFGDLIDGNRTAHGACRIGGVAFDARRRGGRPA